MSTSGFGAGVDRVASAGGERVRAPAVSQSNARGVRGTRSLPQVEFGKVNEARERERLGAGRPIWSCGGSGSKALWKATHLALVALGLKAGKDSLLAWRPSFKKKLICFCDPDYQLLNFVHETSPPRDGLPLQTRALRPPSNQPPFPPLLLLYANPNDPAPSVMLVTSALLSSSYVSYELARSSWLKHVCAVGRLFTAPALVMLNFVTPLIP